jgi:hypothetical protein
MFTKIKSVNSMKSKQLYFSMLVVAMSLGTAWAIRGQFGHEHGAAWAGGIGSLAILLVAKRQDWLSKAFTVVLAGALGWGLGGMMSYGLVVGYGRGNDWPNVFYGLSMLFVIGGLYGFLGGGLFGMALSNTIKKPVKWPKLILEMVAGGIIFYFFLIEQFGWNMTPPRSEVWAVCLGMAVALAWNMIRGKKKSALRVAIFSGLGGGFGFAFGNFLQVLGQISEINFNFWNVMEYSLGFFGGLGLAYGTLTSDWGKEKAAPTKNQIFPLIMLVLVIPLIMWQQNFEWERIQSTFVKLLPSDDYIFYDWVQWGSFVLIVIVGAYWIFRFKKFDTLNYRALKTFFFGHWALYIALSFLITGAFISTYRIEQYLYLVNFGIIFFLIDGTEPDINSRTLGLSTGLKNGALILLFIGILAAIAVNSHGEMKGAKKRFGAETVAADTIKNK